VHRFCERSGFEPGLRAAYVARPPDALVMDLIVREQTRAASLPTQEI
jgi:hypothetical protein